MTGAAGEGRWIGFARRGEHMAKNKRKLTAKEKAERARRKAEFMTIFVNGKQKRVRRPPTIEGMAVEELILRNANPIWLHQNELWEYLMPEPGEDDAGLTEGPNGSHERLRSNRRDGSS
jgi:hypothetical protein